VAAEREKKKPCVHSHPMTLSQSVKIASIDSLVNDSRCLRPKGWGRGFDSTRSVRLWRGARSIGDGCAGPPVLDGAVSVLQVLHHTIQDPQFLGIWLGKEGEQKVLMLRF
jgi:hypothetical protein